ncbi:MAG: LAGLIDADG family homing endonuclease [Candidatus Aenigmarchaeota archaeon]|nr:LAGLIDADG family homing endonuclease [Candidatus Aenigmarchaeota archaeon]
METLAYLKGVLADGHIYQRKELLRIVVRQKDRDWLQNSILPILQQLTNREPKIIQTPDEIYSLWVYTNKKSLPKETLEILLKPLEEIDFEDEKDKLSFVKGFFEAEGSIYLNKNKKNDIRIIMYQKNPRVLERIKEFLEKLEIPAKVYGPYKNGKNSIFRLIIFKRKNSEKFLAIKLEP